VITILAFRHLLVRRLRAVFLLLGFALGVGVMIVLLSVGQAMLDQSRDVSLVGGGELTVLPQGIDIEAMRTGGLSSMFFGIDRSRFLTRQLFGGDRQRSSVSTVSPVIEGKLLYLRHRNRTVTVKAGGEIPSRAAAVGSGLSILSGRWADSRIDSAYVLPTRQKLYDELDRFHVPLRPDSTWGEWHYFNIVVSPREWWYITYLVGGEVPRGNWGGLLLVTHRAPDGRYQRFTAQAPSALVSFDTTRADVAIARSSVRQRDGSYRLHAEAQGAAGMVRLDLTVVPTRNRYFPAVELRQGEIVSGYVVPALSAQASGKICLGANCRHVNSVPAYHDHNWGVWRDVRWEWGTGQGARFNLLYGGVYGPEEDQGYGRASFFLALVDSLGVKQVLRFRTIRYQGARPVSGLAGATAPTTFSLVGQNDADTVHVDVRVTDALATRMNTSGFRRVFLQLRGAFVLRGHLGAEVIADSGMGFFETYTR
jgi:hypothetical protein